MLEIRKSEILEFAMFSEFFWHELAFFPFSPNLIRKKSIWIPWKQTWFAAIRSHPTNQEATLAVCITSMLLVCWRTLRDNVDFLGPPLTCVVAQTVEPQKMTCKVRLKTKVHDSSSSRILRKEKAWWSNKTSDTLDRDSNPRPHD